jgi:hypothetical protein
MKTAFAITFLVLFSVPAFAQNAAGTKSGMTKSTSVISQPSKVRTQTGLRNRCSATGKRNGTC